MKEKVSTLVIGGTGVSGIPLVKRLIERGHNVKIFHSGRHKPSKIDAPWYYDGSVDIIIGNAFKTAGFKQALLHHYQQQGKEKVNVDIVCSMYGNLANIAHIFSQDLHFDCKKFISVGGTPLYDSYFNTKTKILTHIQDESSPILTTTGDLKGEPNSSNPKLNKMIETEKIVFKCHPNSTHLRYPLMYGPYQIIPDEYIILKRILDKRKYIIFPEGLARLPRNTCYGVNGAEALLSVIDTYLSSKKNNISDNSAGEIFLVAEDDQPSYKQWVEIICKAVDYPCLKIIELPFELAKSARPLVKDGGLPLVRIASNRKLKEKTKFVQPISTTEALSKTVKTMKTDLKEGLLKDSQLSQLLQDPFDYDAEDEIIKLWEKKDFNGCNSVKFKKEPGYGMFYYGNLINPADNLTQEQRHKGKYDPNKVKRVVKSKL